MKPLSSTASHRTPYLRKVTTAIWVPKIRRDKDKLIQFWRLPNSRIPIDDGGYQRKKSLLNSQPFLPVISGEFLEAVENAEYEVQFRVRGKVKKFRLAKLDENPVQSTYELLKFMSSWKR